MVIIIPEFLSLQLQGQSIYINLTCESIRLSPEPKKLDTCTAPRAPDIESSEKAGLKV